jgi:3-phytase
MRHGLAASVAILLVAGLAPVGLAQKAVTTPASLPAVDVLARGETVPVGTAAEDAADDPAIWRNARRPSASLIVATDKKAGLYVYGLDGQVRSFVKAGLVNNVDLIDMDLGGVIVVASDRNDVTKALLQVYLLNTSEATLEPIGSVSGGAGEAYGVCLLRDGDALYAFSVLKEGIIEQVVIALTKGAVSGRNLRTMKLQTQTEGCVVDSRSRTLYVGEEDRGIWAFDTRPDVSTEGRLVAAVDGKHLVADVEGLTIMPSGPRGGWLIASSQGDNAYAMFSLPEMKPAGRFRIAAGTFGATQETDGIAVAGGLFGPGYPDGLFVAQDGDNAPSAQNFKLVSWRDILSTMPR